MTDPTSPGYHAPIPRRPAPAPPTRGAYALSDLTDPRIAVVCRKCDRRGEYDVARLIATHGDLPLPSLLSVLGKGCRAPNSWGQCEIVYERLPIAPAT